MTRLPQPIEAWAPRHWPVLTAFGYAVTAYPVLSVVAVGGWIQLDTWLCLRFFAENEVRLQAEGLA